MKQSESIAKLAAALVAVQSELLGVAKDSSNPEFRSSYTSLDAIIAASRPVLTKHGLAVVQGATSPHSDEAGQIAAIAVETMLLHTSGEWIISTAIMPVIGRMLKGGARAAVDPQAGGSALTYGRRYGLSAILCLSTDEDDDGNHASKPVRAPQAKPAVTSGAPEDFPMPMGKNKGVRLGNLETSDLQSAVAWCMEADAKKFESLIDKLNAVIDARTNL